MHDLRLVFPSQLLTVEHAHAELPGSWHILALSQMQAFSFDSVERVGPDLRVVARLRAADPAGAPTA